MGEVKLTFTGDLMSQPGTNEACHKRGCYNFDALYESARRELANTDFLVGNLETPIAGEEMRYTHERYSFNTPTEYVDTLKKYGFELLCLANNHCFDRGKAGLEATIRNIKARGIDCIGGYNSPMECERVYVRELNGMRVAFLNYTYGTNEMAHNPPVFVDSNDRWRMNLFQPQETSLGAIQLLGSAEDIAQQDAELYGKPNQIYDSEIAPLRARMRDEIARARKQADFVIMCMHSGGQYNPIPEAFTRRLASAIMAAGADVIIGNHPHIMQPCEIVHGKLTAYCLGNFICNTRLGQKCEVNPAFNALMNLYIERDDNGVKLKRASFNLMRVSEVDDNLPTVENAAAIYARQPNDEFKKEILQYANLFAGGNKYSEVSDEYFISI